LVLELVDGQSLADRLARGAVGMEEAVAVARQVADALEAAHERGIIHRDLKPANIKLTPDGTVKVLDYGIAKALDPSAASEPSDDSTTTMDGRRRGTILGTAAYMSPEQARGQASSPWKNIHLERSTRAVRRTTLSPRVSWVGVAGGAVRPSTSSRTRRLIDVETHEAVFTWMLQRLAEAGLARGRPSALTRRRSRRTPRSASSCGATAVRANTTSWRSSRAASGIETPTRAGSGAHRPKRQKWGSNDDWTHPHDPDAKMTKMEDGRTHLADKAEHAVDLKTARSSA